MQNGIKQPTDDEALRYWLDTIPVGKYKAVIAKLLDVCLISRATLANWRYGNCRIPASGKRDINKVSKDVSGIEIFKIANPENSAEGVSGGISGKAI